MTTSQAAPFRGRAARSRGDVARTSVPTRQKINLTPRQRRAAMRSYKGKSRREYSRRLFYSDAIFQSRAAFKNLICASRPNSKESDRSDRRITPRRTQAHSRVSKVLRSCLKNQDVCHKNQDVCHVERGRPLGSRHLFLVKSKISPLRATRSGRNDAFLLFFKQLLNALTSDTIADVTSARKSSTSKLHVARLRALPNFAICFSRDFASVVAATNSSFAPSSANGFRMSHSFPQRCEYSRRRF